MVTIRLKDTFQAEKWTKELGFNCNREICALNWDHFHNPTGIHKLEHGDWIIYTYGDIKFVVSAEYFEKYYEVL